MKEEKFDQARGIKMDIEQISAKIAIYEIPIDTHISHGVEVSVGEQLKALEKKFYSDAVAILQAEKTRLENEFKNL